MDARSIVDGKLKAAIEANPSCLTSAKVSSKTVVLDIDGKNGGSWAFEFDAEGKVKLASGGASSDCTIWMKDSTFEKMVKGDLNVPVAFVMRKIKVKGDVGIAGNIGVALQKLF